MKKFLLGSALVMLSTGAALAADMPVKAPSVYTVGCSRVVE